MSEDPLPNESQSVPLEESKQEPTDEEQKAIQDLIAKDPWEEIGFQRPLGSFWYGLSISLISAVISLFFISIIYKYLYPYPEMMGYNRVATVFFAIIYQAFDVGTAFGIERFVAEYRVKAPHKMLEYIRFFIWYQMFTGLVQVTVVSIWIFQYLSVSPAYSYLTWLFLIICQKQWPGMLWVFSSVLNGLQKYNKSRILGFIGGDVFQNITNIVFILLGRWWGQNNPMIGDLMGGAIGYALGAYIDDFFTMILAGHFLNKELNTLGFTLREAVLTHVDKEIVKQCLWFGFQASMVPMLNIVSETIILFMFLEELPQYTTWIILKGFAGGLVGIVNVGNFETTSSIAESYSNGKQQLAQFYVSYALKWNTFLKWFLIMTMLGVYPIIIKVITDLEGLDAYEPALIFIPFLLIEQLFFAFIEISDPILVGTLHIPFYTAVRLGEEIVRVIILFILLKVYHLGQMGPIGIVLTLGYDRFYARLIKMVAALAYINRKVFKVEIYWMSTIVLPLLASLPVLLGSLFFTLVIAPFIETAIGLLPTAAICIVVCIIILPFALYLPLVGLLGAFDDIQLQTFEKSVALSGPSKPIVKIFYRAVAWGHHHCPWKNKFRIPYEIPLQQINELLIMKGQLKLQLDKQKT